MKPWEALLIFALSLCILVGVASLQSVPGYMDAEYYLANGMRLAAGQGWSEPFLWNYLDDPAGLPHPAFTYWMPLASFLAAAGMQLTGKSDFGSARIFPVLLASAVPLISALLAYQLSKRRSAGWMAAGLGMFSGFYMLYLGLVETFGLYMLLGSTFLVVSSRPWTLWQKGIVIGLLAGLMHMSRADGLLWLAAGAGVLLFETFQKSIRLRWRPGIIGLLSLLAGYGLVSGAWYARNLGLYGSLFPPGNSLALFLTEYDQLYTYPAANLSFEGMLSAGLGVLMQIRWNALLANLETAAAVQGSVFLLPLALTGAWRLRSAWLVRLGSSMWLVTLLVMTLIFPLAGSRGGFLHSGAALQPLIWALSAEGLAGFVEIGVRWRNWKTPRALAGFGLIAVLIASVMTLGIAASRLIGEGGKSPWQASADTYQAVGKALEDLSINMAEPVLVNNPPGFYLATGRPALAIPNGDLGTLAQVARRYHASILVLEENTVKDLRELYRLPGDRPGLKYLGSVQNTYLFRFDVP